MATISAATLHHRLCHLIQAGQWQSTHWTRLLTGQSLTSLPPWWPSQRWRLNRSQRPQTLQRQCGQPTSPRKSRVCIKRSGATLSRKLYLFFAQYLVFLVHRRHDVTISNRAQASYTRSQTSHQLLRPTSWTTPKKTVLQLRRLLRW